MYKPTVKLAVFLILVSSIVLIIFANAGSGVSFFEPTLKWKYTLPAYEMKFNGISYDSTQPFSSPAVANGVVYIGSSGGDYYGHDQGLYALNASNGVKLWHYNYTYRANDSPVVANGVVYSGSWDGQFFAFDACSAN